jgi:hypothetical protein
MLNGMKSLPFTLLQQQATLQVKSENQNETYEKRKLRGKIVQVVSHLFHCMREHEKVNFLNDER